MARRTVLKRVVRRSLIGYRFPYQDPFRYVSLRRAGDKAFVAAMGQAMNGTLSGDFNPRAPAAEYALLKRLAGAALDRGMWRLARRGKRLAGVILAQRRPSRPEEGTLFFLGVAPAFRGQGYGKILHARGLEVLARAGCRSYLGGTDVRNDAMLRTFRANGCRAAGTWLCDARTGRRIRRVTRGGRAVR